MDSSEETKRVGGRVWARTGFDLEGIVGALAAWLVGLLLGWLWGPLFWIGAAAAIIILLATRKQTRKPPEAANLVVAPCDGVVHSIARALPPTELRLGAGERTRVRIASSPAATNPVHAPITGEIASVVMEEPNPSVITANHPDLPGLAVAHIALESLGDTLGCTVATGGFGPRLEMFSEPGDPVRAGRVIAKRRLGGWCDVYLAADARLLVSEGQTLIGSETVLCRLKREEKEAPAKEEITEAVAEIMPSHEGVPEEAIEDIAEETVPDTEPELTSESEDEDIVTDSEEPDEAAAKLFEKLKKEAEGE